MTSSKFSLVSGASSTDQSERGNRRSRSKSRGLSKVVKELGDVDIRLAKVELTVADGENMFRDVEARLEEVEGKFDELQGMMEGALNEAIGKCSRQFETSFDSLSSEVVMLKGENGALREELNAVHSILRDMKEEMTLLRRAIANSGEAISSSPTPNSTRVDVPKPKSYKGSRNATEVDNFLWCMEQYFRATNIGDDARKIDCASLYLEDTAMLWWRRRHGEIERGVCTLTTWDDFKRELKRQFYPENVEREARAKLRRLTQKGTIREYVKEFSEVLLEIPDYPDKEAFYTFCDGLQNWAKLEIERRGARDLSTAIAIAESLTEFKKGESYEPTGYKGHGGGADCKGHKEEGVKFNTHKGTSKSQKDDRGGRGPLKCYFCEGPHKAWDCPKRSQLSAILEEREQSQQNQAEMGSLQILNSIKTNIEMSKSERKGLLFVQAKVGGQVVRALVDTGASNNFIKVEEAKRLGLTISGEKGWIKAVNSQPKPICGTAHNVKVTLGEWSGLLNFSVVPIDDYSIVLGMEFLDKVKAVPMPFANTMCILEEGHTCMVPLFRGKGSQIPTLSAMQFSKGLKIGETTFLATLKKESHKATIGMTEKIGKVLEEYQDIMPKELPKEFPPKREVDHKPGVRQPVEVSYYMMPPKFGELRRQSSKIHRKLDKMERTTKSRGYMGARAGLMTTSRQALSLSARCDEDVAGLGGGGCHGPKLLKPKKPKKRPIK